MSDRPPKISARPRRPDLKLVGRVALGLGLLVVLIVVVVVLGARR